MNFENIKEAAKILNSFGLSKIDYSEGNIRICLEKQICGKEDIISEKIIETKNEKNTFLQCSPTVGTVYLTPQDGKEEFIKVGNKVLKGQTICILEAMKMFTELPCEKDGIIKEICVKNGDLVGVGDVLLKLCEV